MEKITIDDALRLSDALKPNTFPTEWKVSHLSALDRKIYNELFLTHENNDADGFAGYAPDTPLSQQLLVPLPYAGELYSRYLLLQVAAALEETESYNLQAALFNNEFSQFKTWYNRTHLPLSHGRVRF